MAKNDRSALGCGLLLITPVLAWLLVRYLLSAAAVAHILVGDRADQAHRLTDNLWGTALSVPLAMVLIRCVLHRDGRLRRHTTWPRRWLGILLRAVVLLCAVNFVAYQALALDGPLGRPSEVITGHVWPAIWKSGLTAIVVLIVTRAWDRHSWRLPTRGNLRRAVREVDAVTAEVRAANQRVAQQTEQVRTRLRMMRAGGPAHRGSGLEFPALCGFHRESYQCADLEYGRYESAQTSMHRVEYLVRRTRKASTRLRREGVHEDMQALAAHLEGQRDVLKVDVDQGLNAVRGLNIGTADLKYEIRDTCGPQGQQWYAELETRIDEARAARGESPLH
ncbi:hypothetical protein [Lentzea sp. NPDC055074]